MCIYKDYKYEILYDEAWESWHFRIQIHDGKWYDSDCAYQLECDAQLACEEVIAALIFTVNGQFLSGFPHD